MATLAPIPMSTAPIPTGKTKARGALCIVGAVHVSAGATAKPDLRDEETFVAAVTKARSVMRTVVSRVVGREMTEDLVAESVLNAWRGRATYNGQSSVNTWLGKVAFNTALTYLRRQHSRPRSIEASEEVKVFLVEGMREPGPNPERAAIESEVLGIACRAVRRMSPCYRASFYAWMAEEDLQADPTSTRKIQASRARRYAVAEAQAKLRICLAPRSA